MIRGIRFLFQKLSANSFDLFAGGQICRLKCDIKSASIFGKPTTVSQLGESGFFSKNCLLIPFDLFGEGQLCRLKCDKRSGSIFVKPTTVSQLGESGFFSKNCLLIPFDLFAEGQIFRLKCDIRLASTFVEGAVSWQIDGRYQDFWPKFTKFKLLDTVLINFSIANLKKY